MVQALDVDAVMGSVMTAVRARLSAAFPHGMPPWAIAQHDPRAVAIIRDAAMPELRHARAEMLDYVCEGGSADPCSACVDYTQQIITDWLTERREQFHRAGLN